MPLGKGYWFVTHNFDLIDIVEHEGYLRDLSNAMWTSPDTVGPREYAQATTLGMKPGEPWLESVPRETPSVRRARWLKEAMKRGWVRIRQAPNRMMVFEAWKVNDDLLASLGLAVKQMGLSPETPIEIHEVSSDRPRAMTAGALRAYLAGEESEATGEVGFSVYSNPPKGKARFHRWGSKRDAPQAFPNPGGSFHTRQTGHFDATETARLYGGLQRFRLNPAALEAFVKPEEGDTSAKMFLGLKRGLGEHSGKDIAVDDVVQFVKKMRRSQLAGDLPGGASFITQRGFFTNWKKKHLHPDEDSLQILIYPEYDGGETKASFEVNMGEIAKALSNHYEQESVILHLVVDDDTKFLGHAHQ